MRLLLSCSVLLFVCLAACQREPAIVIRFDPPDASLKASPQQHDAAIARHDASSTQVAECATDAECTVVKACCSCVNGGTQVAVSKHDAAQRAEHDCGKVMCAQVMSTDPSCSKHPACVAGTCTLK